MNCSNEEWNTLDWAYRRIKADLFSLGVLRKKTAKEMVPNQKRLLSLVLRITIHIQCQLVKDFENWTNSLNIGIKCHLGMNLETNGVDHTVCRAVFLFYCMTNKQVWKMPAMWYNDSVSQNRYVKLTGTWNLCWRAKFLSGLTGSVCFLIRPSTSGGFSPECSRRK